MIDVFGDELVKELVILIDAADAFVEFNEIDAFVEFCVVEVLVHSAATHCEQLAG